ncbi:hypothetical protein PLICRDRAFT_41115 [Plicaturopsis crispa FD-325 SS-3]|nr:hypothetical protein PLICRDRAFT_41115 [Plicaturopsis crispa FD-325 SS-3]
MRLNDPLNTTILHDGKAVYHVKTPFKVFRRPDTTLRRVDGHQHADVACIRWGGLTKSLSVSVHGRDVRPHKKSMFSDSETFTAADGKEYKWKIKNGKFPKLVRKTGIDKTIAEFHAPSSVFSLSHKVTLKVDSDGLAILDDIIATFIYVENRRRRNNGDSKGRQKSNEITALDGGISLDGGGVSL